MGRTFDTIQLVEARLPLREDAPETPTAVVVEPRRTEVPAMSSTTVPLADLPADAPYIEVGLHQLDASPEVLAATPTPRPAPAAARLQLRPATNGGGAVAGTLPAEVVAYHDPGHPLAVQYRDLTAGVLEQRPGIGPRALAFTTALAGTPPLAVLLNLGATAARLASRRVVVVEADLRQPTLAGALHLSPGPGLVEVLAGVVPLDQAVRPTAQANLLVLPAGEVAAEAFGLLRVEPVRHLLQRLALRADLLLLLLPRWDGRPDVLALSACCDALFLVAPEAEADQPHVRELTARLPALGVPLAGTVLVA